MSFTAALILTAVIAVLAKTGAWIWQLRTRNAGMVDAIWAWTLGGLAAVYALCGDAPLLALMGGAWGLRLGWHLWVRNHGKPEDWRYAQLRKEWGERADSKMFWFFQFQNLFTLLLAASAMAMIDGMSSR
jgi:steroid 5-alpha reductase family enzyme